MPLQRVVGQPVKLLEYPITADKPTLAISMMNREAGPFDLSHFARLCLILRDDLEETLAHIGTGKILMQWEQANRVSRGANWRTVIRLFSEVSMRSRIDFHGIIVDAKPLSLPVCLQLGVI